MHVILGLLGTIVTILWLLHRLAEMGIDLGGLNPFLWARRRKWQRYHDANPIFKVESPMDATALLLVAIAKADGDMSSEEKRELLRTFADEFHLSKKEAASLLISSSYLLGKGEEVRNKLKDVLAPSVMSFSSVQISSAINLMQKMASFATPASDLQADLLNNAVAILEQTNAPKGKWN